MIAVDDLNGIIHVRRNGFDKRNLILDRDGVGHDQRLRVMGARADAVDCPATRLNPDKVLAEVVQVLLNSCLSRFADGHDTDHSGNPDHDSENS